MFNNWFGKAKSRDNEINHAIDAVTARIGAQLDELGVQLLPSALKIANKRIGELEKYNLDLANESHDKSKRIKGLELDLGLAKISLEKRSALLASFEIAFLER